MSVASNVNVYLRIPVCRHNASLPMCAYSFFQSLNATSTFLFIAATTLYYLVHLFIRKNVTDKDGNRIPPGPLMRLPYLPDYPERTLHAWAQKYGPLYSFYLGNQLYVVVSEANMARELLVNNGAIFSSRKQYFVKNQTILRGRAITASPYGETWYVSHTRISSTVAYFLPTHRRNHRKIAAQLLTQKAIAGYNDTLDYECRIMMRSLYKESMHGAAPINPAHYTGRYTLK
jgi:cytochrome P450